MSEEKPMSRADIEREARRLRASSEWDPRRVQREDPLDAMRRLDQELQGQEVYEKSEGCQACDAARAESEDSTALCEQHLQSMLMGTS